MTDCLLVHAFRSHATGENDTLGALADLHVTTAIERMHAAPAEAWTVARLAAVSGLSRSVLAARFQERLGESPLRYLARWRMMRAARSLTETSQSVDPIAELGYERSPAFQKAFKRWQGFGPGAYRRAARRSAAPTLSLVARP